MKIVSGTTNQYIYFVAVDPTDLQSRRANLNLTKFTSYRSRNGASGVVMTTPTIVQINPTGMPGLYGMLVDEDTTITVGYDSQEMAFHITHTGMAPVTRTIELYRPKISLGETLANIPGELSDVPPATSGIAYMIQWLYMMSRNKISQSTNQYQQLYNNGGTPIASSYWVNDGTTQYRNQWNN